MQDSVKKLIAVRDRIVRDFGIEFDRVNLTKMQTFLLEVWRDGYEEAYNDFTKIIDKEKKSFE